MRPLGFHILSLNLICAWILDILIPPLPILCQHGQICATANVTMGKGESAYSNSNLCKATSF